MGLGQDQATAQSTIILKHGNKTCSCSNLRKKDGRNKKKAQQFERDGQSSKLSSD